MEILKEKNKYIGLILNIIHRWERVLAREWEEERGGVFSISYKTLKCHILIDLTL